MAGTTAPPIVLLTDFGLSDAYVGMMRGVISSINPAASVIDLTHGISPQNIAHGAAVLADASPYFPPGSIFVAVVDPGVGTQRAAILLETPDARFLAPDNGLLTLVCRRCQSAFGDADAPATARVPTSCRAWRLTNPDYWRRPVSSTFHGRDVFAPVSAHLSLGATPSRIGKPISAITALPLPTPRPDGNVLRGSVIYADAFGNLITNLTADILDDMGISPGDPNVTVAVAGHTINGLSQTFHSPPPTSRGDPPDSGLRALIGSHNRLEIALIDGSAAAALNTGAAATVQLTVC